MFDIEFPYKHSYFEPFCPPAKIASETVIRPIRIRKGTLKTAILLFSLYDRSKQHIATTSFPGDFSLPAC